MTCSVSGCQSPVKARGWCDKHYRRMREYGRPELPTFEEKFWAKVDVRGPDECWPWLRAKQGFGHGVVRVPTLSRNVPAHRVAWWLANGRQPQSDMYVLHTCDNPPCCNPAHLYEGTPADNVRDIYERGRSWAQNATHCHKGHEWSEENTLPREGGRFVEGRRCRACAEALAERWRIRPERYVTRTG